MRPSGKSPHKRKKGPGLCRAANTPHKPDPLSSVGEPNDYSLFVKKVYPNAKESQKKCLKDYKPPLAEAQTLSLEEGWQENRG